MLNKKDNYQIITLSLVILLSIFFSSCAKEKIKIGYNVPRSGEPSHYGTTYENSVKLAYKDLLTSSNTDDKQKEILRNIEFIFQDSQCKPEVSRETIKKLFKEKVIAIFGDVCSGASLEIAPIAGKKKIPLISSVSSKPLLSGISPYFFRTAIKDDVFGPSASKFIYENNNKRIMIFHNDDAYTETVADIFQKEFENQGLDVFSKITSIGKSLSNQSNLIDSLQEQEIDSVIIFPTIIDQAVNLVRVIRDNDLNITFYGGEVFKQDFIRELNEMNGLIVLGLNVPGEKFIKKYQAAYNIYPEAYSSQGYDAGIAILTAIINGADTSEKIRDFLANNTFKGFEQDFKFDDKGDVVLSNNAFKKWKVENRKFIEIE